MLKNHIWGSVGSEINSENYSCSNYNTVSANKGKHCNACRLQCKVCLAYLMEADTSVCEEECVSCHSRSFNRGVGHLKVLYL